MLSGKNGRSCPHEARKKSIHSERGDLLPTERSGFFMGSREGEDGVARDRGKERSVYLSEGNSHFHTFQARKRRELFGRCNGEGLPPNHGGGKRNMTLSSFGEGKRRLPDLYQNLRGKGRR